MYEKEKRAWIGRVDEFFEDAKNQGLERCFPDLERMEDKTKKDLGE